MAPPVSRVLTLLIVDDHPIIAEAIANRFEREEDFGTVVVARTGREAVQMYAHHKPDIVLCDLSLDESMSGLEVARRLVRGPGGATVVVFTSYTDADTIAAALDVGVAGYLSKGTPPATLVEYVRAAAGGEQVFDPTVLKTVTGLWRNRDARPAPSPLSQRETEILILLSTGITGTTEICEALNLSDNSVRTHLARLYRKLGVNDRTQAVIEGIRAGYVPPPQVRNEPAFTKT